VRSNLPHLFLLAAGLAAIPASPSERAVESVLPALAYGSSCSSTVRLQNLSASPVTVEVEAHRASGALVALAGQANRVIHLEAGRQSAFQLEIDEETTAAWVKIRERLQEAQPAPAVALSGVTECRDANQLRVASREVAFPTRDPWFSSDVAGLHGAVLTLINTSEQPARASACYSAGILYSVPDPRPGLELVPLCSATVDVQIPPFGTREFPIERNGNSQFSLRTRGNAIVLQMLRPADDHVRIYSVDSTIQFGEEVPESHPPGH
jgi:hypothetical protein